MWVKMTNGTSHQIMVFTHGQKWVGVNAVSINGDITNTHHQWYQKGPSGKSIALVNMDFADMLWGRTRPTSTWAESNKVFKFPGCT
jgi:hypothetical protein